MRLGTVVCVAVVLGWGGLVQAAPLDVKQVPADAKWLVHVDVDSLHASTVVQNAIKKCMEMHPQAAEHLNKAKQHIGMDPRKDLHGVTLYGKKITKPGEGEPQGVMIVNAQVDRKLLTEKAEKAADHKVAKHGDTDIHSWTDKHHGKPRTVFGAFYKDGVVFAGNADDLKGALDLLAGKGASVAPGSALSGKIIPGSTVIVRATGIATADLPTRSPIVKQIESVRIAMGEHDGQSFFRGKAVMTNTEVVGQVKAILEGGKAMVALGCKEEQVKKLVDAVKIMPEEKTLSVSWSAPAGEVWEVIQKAAKKMAERHAKWGPKGEKKECPVLKGCPSKHAPAAKPVVEEEF